MNTLDAKRVLETALICAPDPLSLRDMGVLFADEIEVEDEDEEAEVDVRGQVSAVDTGARTFVVRDVTFHYTPGTTEEKDGTFAADLRNGAVVRVRGTLPAGGAGNVEASEVDFRV